MVRLRVRIRSEPWVALFLLLTLGQIHANADPARTVDIKGKHSNSSSVFDMIRLVVKANAPVFFSSTPKVIPQKISVIGAGQGRTGTSSLRAALNRLGLNSYHMEAVLETPGHIDLWHAYYHLKSITIDDVIDRIEGDGFNATLDGPSNFHFQRQLERNPNSKVILTLRRKGAQSWVDSMYGSVLRFHPLIRRVPFRWIPRMKRQSQFFAAMNLELGIPVTGPENMPVREYMAEAYDNWTRHVQSTVPADRLLTFYAEDGWEPLCRFLSPLDEEIESNCNAVLASGEAYPHVNDTVFIQRLTAGLNMVCTVVELSPLLVVLYLIRAFIKRYRKPAKSKRS